MRDYIPDEDTYNQFGDEFITPKQAVCSRFSILQTFGASLVTFGVCVGLGYATYKDVDHVLMQDINIFLPRMFSDMFMTTFLTCFVTCLSISVVSKKAVESKKISLVDEDELRATFTRRCFPLRCSKLLLRALLCALYQLIWYWIPSVILLTVLCVTEVLPGGTWDTCYLDRNLFIYLKAVWALGQAALVTPLTILGATNSKFYPPQGSQATVN